MKSKQLFVPWVSLVLMLVGMRLSICQVLEFPSAVGKNIVPLAIMAGMSVILFLLFSGRVTVIALFAVLASMAVTAYWQMERLMEDGRAFWFYLNKRCEAYFHTSLPYEEFGIKGDLDNSWLILLFLALCAVFIALFAFRMRSRWYGLSPLYLVPCAGLIFGKAPEYTGILFSFLGGTIALFWMSGRERGGKSSFRVRRIRMDGTEWKKYLVFSLVVISTLLLAYRVTESTRKEILSHSVEVEKAELAMEEKVTRMAENLSDYMRGITAGVDSDGKMSNKEPMYARRTVMEVTVREKPSEDLYLRGFVGSHFRDGRWTESDVSTFNKIFEKDYYQNRYVLSALDYYVMALHVDLTEGGEPFSSDYSVLSEPMEEDYSAFYNGAIGTIYYVGQQAKIKYVDRGKRSRYTYLPYLAATDELYDKNYDMIEQDYFRGQNGLKKVGDEYNFVCFDFSRRQKNRFYRNMRKRGMRDYSDRNFLTGKIGYEEEMPLEKDIVVAYLKYAAKEFGYQKESSILQDERFKSYLSDVDELKKGDTIDRVSAVQKVLWKNTSYSFLLSDVPAGDNYVDYFLYRQRKGFCEHYATVGTLLMRELGIPARYVGGYRVSADSFVKNKYGTYTAAVLDSDAHAWTEVLYGQLGWYPQEMTPSATNKEEPSMAEEQRGQVQVTPKPTPIRQKSNRVTTEKKVTPTPVKEPFVKKEKKKKENRTVSEKQIPMGTIICVAGMIAFLILLECWVIGRYSYRNRVHKIMQARGSDRKKYIVLRLREMLLFLRNCGIRVTVHMPEEEWIKYVRELCGEQMTTQEYQQFVYVIQKAAFSERQPEGEEYEVFQRICRKVEKLAYAKASGLRKVYLRLMGKKERF